jgi:hypothetical protein
MGGIFKRKSDEAEETRGGRGGKKRNTLSCSGTAESPPRGGGSGTPDRALIRFPLPCGGSPAGTPFRALRFCPPPLVAPHRLEILLRPTRHSLVGGMACPSASVRGGLQYPPLPPPTQGFWKGPSRVRGYKEPPCGEAEGLIRSGACQDPPRRGGVPRHHGSIGAGPRPPLPSTLGERQGGSLPRPSRGPAAPTTACRVEGGAGSVGGKLPAAAHRTGKGSAPV